MDSILDSIKKLLGIDPSYVQFDQDIIIAINTALATLEQIGLHSFYIEDNTATWNDYLGDRLQEFAFVKNYIHIKVRMLWDPATSGILAEAYNQQLKELEFRIHLAANPGEETS